MITRRTLLKAGLGAGLGLPSLGGYALGYEPVYRLAVTEYKIKPKNWPKNYPLSVAIVADIHAGGYNMPLSRVEEIVSQTNALKCDLIVFLGDCMANYKTFGHKNPLTFHHVAEALSELKAPLGVYSVLGNHDWWDDDDAQRRFQGPTKAHIAFAANNLPVLENDAIKITHRGKKFWLAGLGDQFAFPRNRARQRGIRVGVDDLRGTMSKMREQLPIVLLAHEPNIFHRMPERVDVTLCGHTHGGQINLFGFHPIQFTARSHHFIYGHYENESRNMIVSGGLGCSLLPVRIGRPPEIVKVMIG